MLLWITTGWLLAAVSAVTVEVRVGEDAILNCLLAATFPEWFGPPPDNVQLTSGGAFTTAGMSYKDDKHLNISNAQTTHSGDYRCEKDNAAGTVTLVVNSYDVTVTLVDISNNSIAGSGQIGGVQNDEITVMCKITGGFPVPSVTMTIKENNTDLGTPTVTSSLTDQKTYDVNATVAMNATRELDLKHVVCNASYDSVNEYRTAEAELYWTVAPLLSTFGWGLRDQNGISFNCQLDHGRPRTSLTFEIDGKPLNSNYTYVLKETKCVMDSITRRYSCKAEVEFKDLKKEDNGKPVICVKTFQGQRSVIDHDYKLIRKFPPTSVNVTADAPIVITEQNGVATVTLTCSVDSAYDGHPPRSGVRITWLKGSVELNSTNNSTESPAEYGGLSTQQELVLPVDKGMNGQEITCNARYVLTDIKATYTINLTYYPAILKPSSDIYRAYMNDDVMIPCLADSKPKSSFKWINVGATETEVNVTDANTVDNMYTMVIQRVQKDHAGSYRCEAQNGIGKTATKTIELRIYDRPSQPQFMMRGSPEEMSFTIRVETSDTAPTVPETFYIQYRKSAAKPGPWIELTQSIPNTLPGEAQRGVNVEIENAQSDTTYDVRIKRVTALGLTSYSSTQTVTTKKPKETETKDNYNKAIIISVLVTAAVFVVIIIIVIVVMKRGACGGSSKTGSAEFSMK